MSDRASAAMAKAAVSAGAVDPLIGRTVNERFKITGLIARGGMGKVYKAEQAPLGRVCALKVLNPNYAGDSDPEFHKRFFLEASIASKLTHPNTVTIFDYGRTDDDIYYMAMEYLEGYTLHRAIRTAGFFPEDRAAHVARQICRALREAHALGVIHRDLKPANIFLVEHGDETDFVKVLDFGLVKNVGEGKGEDLTQTGLFMGSPKYMAPEQIRGDKVDARTDIYALGIILYEMVTGKVPFDRPNSVNILMAHVNEEPPPLRTMNPNIQISELLEATIAKCMAKDMNERFKSMDEVLGALKRAGGGALTQTITGVGGMTGEYNAFMPSLAPGSQMSGAHPSMRSSGTDSGLMASPLASAANVSPDTTGATSQVSGGGQPSSKGMLFGAIGLGALAVIGTVVAVTRGSSAPPKVDAPKVEQVAVQAPVQPVPAAAAAPVQARPVDTVVKVRLTTDPDSVNVKEDGVEVCDQTPCDLKYAGKDADPTKEHKLTFSKSGYRSETKTIKATDTTVSVKLTREYYRPAAPTPAAPKPEATPSGYKPDVPY